MLTAVRFGCVFLARHVAALPVIPVPVITAGSRLMQLWAESAIALGDGAENDTKSTIAHMPSMPR